MGMIHIPPNSWFDAPEIEDPDETEEYFVEPEQDLDFEPSDRDCAYWERVFRD